MHRLRARTLITWGRDDRGSPMDMMLVPMRTIPDVEVHVFPNCGHWVMLEEQAWEATVLAFLTRCLLASTLRPKKVHENVVSQCDNLLLMRMNSHDDLAELSRLFSSVPPGLIDGASTFAMGQALVAGKLLPRPAYVLMGTRVSEEGGADIPATRAEPRRPV